MKEDTKLIQQVLSNLQNLSEKKKLTSKQKQIAQAAPPHDEITGADFKALNSKSKEDKSLEDVLESFIQLQENPAQYDAPKGSTRAKKLDMTKADLESGDPKRIARGRRRRDRMEKEERDKKKNKKNESLSISIYQLNELISEVIEAEKLSIILEKIEELEEKKKKRKKKKKKKKKNSAGGLSAAVKKSLNKKADKRGFTRGSVYSEFRKGLAAYYTSGSRKGMSAHQWAHARVNSANPSKSWAVVKKKKNKKGKKKK